MKINFDDEANFGNINQDSKKCKFFISLTKFSR